MLHHQRGRGPRAEGAAARQYRGQDGARAVVAMLNLPTLWTVLVINFLAVGLIWAYVAYTYPKLEAARFWGASCLTAAVGGFSAMLIIVFPATLLPLLV